MSVSIEIDTSEVDRFFDKLLPGVQNFMNALSEGAAQIFAEQMREAIPVDTGNAQSSISVTDYGEVWEIGPHVGYTAALDQGSQPHEIYAVNAKALRIPLEDGSVIFRKHVHHPGTEATHFIAETLDNSEDPIKEMIESATEAFFAELK